MGGGSKQSKPQFLTPPDIGGLRPQYAGLLSGLIRGFQGGGNPLYSPLDPLQSAGLQQFSGLLSGQDLGGGPFGAAGRGLQETIETGMPIDTSPITAQARNFYSQELVPDLLEQYGSRFGYRRGGALAEPLARAGRDVSLGVSSQLLPYAESARQRQQAGIQTGLSFPERGFALGQQVQGGQQNALALLMQVLQGGVGGLSSQGGFAAPSFYPGQGQQNLAAGTGLAGALAAIITAINSGGGAAAAGAAACWIAEAIYGPNAPEVWAIRIWLHAEFRRRWYGRPILWLYQKLGRWAANQPWLVYILKPLFGRALRNALSV